MAPILSENTARLMPDVAGEGRPVAAGRLERVGMAGIETPVLLMRADGGHQTVAARVDAYVDLDRPEARGIHMSRLYLGLDRLLGAEPLSPCLLRRLLREFLGTHADLSHRAEIRIAFDFMVRRPALASDNAGWRSYPVSLGASLEQGHFSLELGFTVVYSSTCPCSAALARQLIQERFRRDFPPGTRLDHDAVLAWLGSEQGICATPHSQRSEAEVRVRLAPGFGELPIEALIDRVEQALRTPVQTAVKREDEQAFARLNGENLMFCEDAARRVQAALAKDERVLDFRVLARHMESLHPHDAVAVAVKGVAGGYSA